ncbi:hypothetical protein Pelo_1605 [Pelomyxa schiedti]|nr:hypothetical protein Pelo_1605 [Pelomyxa schiedti]
MNNRAGKIVTVGNDLGRPTRMRDQVGALAAGVHARCGARCPLRLISAIMGGGGCGGGSCGGDGTLVLRLMWLWLMETSRFYSVEWVNVSRQAVMITFGVSLVLLTLTHEVRWWAKARREVVLLAANEAYLLVEGWSESCLDRSVFSLQDRASGMKIPLFAGEVWRSAANWKWLVVFGGEPRTMTVVEIPRKGGVRNIKKPTVVSLDSTWGIGELEFVGPDENHLLFRCSPGDKLTVGSLKLVLVDLEKTCASNKIVVVSSTDPILDGHPRRYVLRGEYFAFRKESGSHCFINQRGNKPAFTIEEGTGKSTPTFPKAMEANFRVSQMNQSQFCTLGASCDTYEVWDVNDTTKPVRTQSCIATKHSFVEGGLLFQTSASLKEMHVTEESSGAHVITFNLFRPLLVTIAPGTPATRMRDQVGALAAGAHPRCGALFPLTKMIIMGSDGTLVLRVLWAWLMARSRLHWLRWTNEQGQVVMIAFGVSSDLLSLTRDARWWVERPGELVYGAYRDYLAWMEAGGLFGLQDRATGERVPLFVGDGFGHTSNGKWLVSLCIPRMVVVEIPRKSTCGGGGGCGVGNNGRKPTVVSVGRRWEFCKPMFLGPDENHLLLRCSDLGETYFELVLVDLEQSCASNKLVVLSSTTPRLDDLPLAGNSFRFLLTANYLTLCNVSGSRCFIMAPGVDHAIVSIEEGTGKTLFRKPTEPLKYHVSQLNKSQFCIFWHCSPSYEVWDVNDATKPVRTQSLLSGCRAQNAVVEGGLLFQMSESMKEMHVTEESSGSHIVTFHLFRPLLGITRHFSSPLSPSLS